PPLWLYLLVQSRPVFQNRKRDPRSSLQYPLGIDHPSKTHQPLKLTLRHTPYNRQPLRRLSQTEAFPFERLLEPERWTRSSEYQPSYTELQGRRYPFRLPHMSSIQVGQESPSHQGDSTIGWASFQEEHPLSLWPLGP